MPTRVEFELAAAQFDQAANDVASLAANVDGIDTSQVLVGGTLGQAAPLRIEAAAANARTCQMHIEAAAQTCRERAAIIVAYEAELAQYELASHRYHQLAHHWTVRYNRWWRSLGSMPHPGARPVPPVAPAAPPAWADVRRP